MTPTPAETPNDVMFLLSWASRALINEHAEGLAGLGLSPRAYCVLLKANEASLTQTQLGDQCGIDKTTMVATLDELEKRGFAERRLSATDRRARQIAVTEAGSAVLGQARQAATRIQDDVLATVAPADRRIFLSVLEALVDGPLSVQGQCDRRAPADLGAQGSSV